MLEGKKFFAVRGYNKSGTNWLCRLLNLHPQVSCSGEFHWNRISSQLIETYNESENLYNQDGLLDATWHAMDRFIKESIVLACDKDAIWVGDRTPSHIEPSLIIGAKVFNLIRDGRDIMVSSAFHFFNNPDFFPKFNSLEELKEPLALFRADPTHFHRYPEQLLACDALAIDTAYHWAETIQKNQDKIDGNPDMECLEVRYEALHHDIEAQRSRLYAFLEVDPELAVPLEFNTQPGFKKEKPNMFLRKGAVGDWENYFTPRLQAIFNEHAGETLIKLGYVDSLNWLELDIPSSPSTDNLADAAASPKSEVESKPSERQIAETVTMMSRARAVLAYGGLDGIVQRPMFDHDGGVFPHFAIRAEGCRIYDSVGRAYIDWMNGWGPVLAGYNRPEVIQAIKNQMDAGPTLSLMHPIEIDVAELLVEMIPCAEMVAFGKNGSDAVNASLRIARAVTQRKMILQCGFHGFHEWYTCLHPDVEGMPAGLREQVEPFPYNDLDAFEDLLNKHTGDVAAVIMEPVNLKIPDQGYLEGIRRLTEAHGCLLIFDEMVTAFRLANGGAQEYFGVVPDLACIGKGMANGMPLSAVVGKREYMQRLPACGFGMTFRGETFSFAAAKAVLELLQREPVCKHIAEVGRRLRSRFESVAQSIGVHAVLAGPEARMTIEFHDCGELPQSNVRNLFLQECLKQGVLTNGTLLPNYAHDDQAIDESVVAFEAALKVVAVAIESGSVDSSRPHGGSPVGPRAFVSSGFLESIRNEDDEIQVHGWMLLEDGAPDSIELISNSGFVVPAVCCPRPDIAAGFPSRPSALMSGYQASLPAAEFEDRKQIEFTIVANRQTQVAFRCLVVQQFADQEGEPTWNGPYSTNDGVLYV